MNTARSENGCGICPWNSGPFSSATIIPVSSIGRPFRPIRRGSIPTPDPMPHQTGGAVREGSALLQGIVTCGHCGRRLHVHYRGRNSTPGYHCAAKIWSMAAACTASTSAVSVIEQAVADAFLQAITPAAIEAMRLVVRTTASQPRCGLVAMAFGSGARPLRGGAGRAPLPGGGTRKPPGRSRAGNRMGEPSA